MPRINVSHQASDGMYGYHGDFEVHITVDTPSEETLGRFRQWCCAKGFKCVRIVLARGAHVEQPMATWHRHDVSLAAVVTEAESRVAEMGRAGFLVMRAKVEAALQNHEVPGDDAEALGHRRENYFEHHVKLLRPTIAPREALMLACEKHEAHLSRNAFREIMDGWEERFVTLRSYGVGRLSSEQQLQHLQTSLHDLGERIVACESEYCVYDTNLDLDAGWLRRQA